MNLHSLSGNYYLFCNILHCIHFILQRKLALTGIMYCSHNLIYSNSFEKITILCELQKGNGRLETESMPTQKNTLDVFQLFRWQIMGKWNLQSDLHGLGKLTKIFDIE